MLSAAGWLALFMTAYDRDPTPPYFLDRLMSPDYSGPQTGDVRIWKQEMEPAITAARRRRGTN